MRGNRQFRTQCLHRKDNKQMMEREVEFAWFPRIKHQSSKNISLALGSFGQCESVFFCLIGRKA